MPVYSTVKAALGRGEASLAPVGKAVAMAPASSAHRVSYGRVLRRLGRRQEALKFAGMARALARTVGERAEAQGLLGELAKELASPAPEVEARGPAAVPGSSTGAGAPAGDATGRRATALRPRGAGVDIGGLVDDCNADNATCAGAFPVIAAACDAATSPSLVACRFAGYILDVGLGMPPDPAKGAAFTPRAVAWRSAGGAQEACMRLGVSLASSGVAADMARAKTVLKL